MDGSRKSKDDGWGGSWRNYMVAKQAKLDHQFDEGARTNFNSGPTENSPSDSDIFKGVAIYVNGYTVPSADELRRIMMRYGGKYHVYYSQKLTTHIIATNLPNSKIANLKEEKVLKPEWITDSIKAGYRLLEEPYRLYISNRNPSQSCLNFPGTSRTESVNDNSNSMNSVTENPDLATRNETDNKTSFLKPGNENFLDQFYSKSRLHHISTMSLELKDLVKELDDNSDGSFPGRQKLQKWIKNSSKSSDAFSKSSENFNDMPMLPTGAKKSSNINQIIMHVDMDCFFASVGLRNLPHLKGRPVVVTHAKNPSSFQPGNEKPSMSEIACCSYEARNVGVRNGMFLGKALELCPDLVTIPYDFDSYKEVSRLLYKTVASYTLEMEAVSCDELYIDCASLLHDTGATPEEFAQCLRNNVKKTTGCACSVGIAGNFLLARLATKKAKPNGVFSILSEECSDFIRNHHVQDLPGVGANITARLNELNVETCADLQRMSLNTLQNQFGAKNGQTLFNLCRGIDNREIRKQTKRSSVSSEINYGIRFEGANEVTVFLDNLSHEIESRLKNINSIGKTITLKLKVRRPDAPVETLKYMGHGLCFNMSRSITMPTATNDANVISRECNNLFKATHVIVTDIRGVGIQVTKLVSDGMQNPLASMDTLDRFVKWDENQKKSLQNESPTKSSPVRTPKGSPSSTRGSPKRGSPRRAVPFRYRAIEEHFRDNPTILSSIQSQVTVDKDEMSVVNADEDSPFNVRMPLNEIKHQLKSWIISHNVPLDEDVDIVGHFIDTLVTERQLEKVGIILKILNRLLSQNVTQEWKTANLKIQGVAQLSIKKYCGGHLQI